MVDMDSKFCKTDPDVLYREDTEANSTLYYQYIILYTEYVLRIIENFTQFLVNKFGKWFKLKEKSIATQTQYLGNKITQVEFGKDTKSCNLNSLS